MTLAISLPNIQSQLAQATTPHQTREIEKISRAAIAWANEQNDYELFMQAWRVYLTARRKTTELIKYDIDHNINVIDEQFHFTPMQWSRRLKELAVEQDKIDEYFDNLIANQWQPSIAGVLRHANGQEIDREERAVNDIKRGTKALHDSGWTDANIHAIVDEVIA